VRGYVVDVNFYVFDVSVEEFGAGFGIVLVDVGYLDIATAYPGFFCCVKK
jgi:hypothetical protein